MRNANNQSTHRQAVDKQWNIYSGSQVLYSGHQKHFYLNTPLKRFKYLRLKWDNISDSVIEEYNLKEKVTNNGYAYV